MRASLLPAVAVVLALTLSTRAESKKLVVHEWGTFTSLQDETGRAIGGLNSVEEKLPPFVHRLHRDLIIEDGRVNVFSKSIARSHPDVTMRLETPVLYFHPADDHPLTLDVTATFKGGILSEFYPKADASTSTDPRPTTPTEPASATPTLPVPPPAVQRITPHTTGTLAWRGARVGGDDVKLPETDSSIWLAPRIAKSAPVTVNGESESYLFYRGVGNVDAPLRVTRHEDKLRLHDARPAALRTQPWSAKGMWLAEFRGDTCAFRAIDQTPASTAAATDDAPAVACLFAEGDFSKQNLLTLRAQMKSSLISDGLYPDEAEAMLETWKESYFKTGGQRLFFLVPKTWTDHVLPLQVSVPCEVTRSMIGRIELVTAQQRESLARIAGNGDRQVTSVTAERLYHTLGRFNDALLLDELRRRPTERLANFARAHNITGALVTAPVAPAAPAAPTAAAARAAAQ